MTTPCKAACSPYRRVALRVVRGGGGNLERGSWKFEIDRQDQPWLGYYDTRGKTVFRIGCGAHFDMRTVYPAAPKQDDTKVSITRPARHPACRATRFDYRHSGK